MQSFLFVDHVHVDRERATWPSGGDCHNNDGAKADVQFRANVEPRASSWNEKIKVGLLYQTNPKPVGLNIFVKKKAKLRT